MPLILVATLKIIFTILRLLNAWRGGELCMLKGSKVNTGIHVLHMDTCGKYSLYTNFILVYSCVHIMQMNVIMCVYKQFSFPVIVPL